MPDVFAVLGQDHAEVKQMLAELENGPTRMGGASTAQLQDRKQLVEALVIAESKHEAVEEEFFWPVVQDLSGDGAELAGQGTDQEQERQGRPGPAGQARSGRRRVRGARDGHHQ